MLEWRTVRLDEVAQEVTVGHVGPMVDEYRPTGVPFLRSQNVRPHQVDLEDVKFIDGQFHNRLRKSALRPGDVVTVRTGNPGQTAVIPASLPEANCADLVITRPGPELNSRWLSYYLNWVTDSHISTYLVGAVQQHFNVRAAKNLRLHLPPRPEQLAIAEVLGALDDKIAANAKLGALADELVRSMYARLGTSPGVSKAIGDLAQHPRDLVDPTGSAPDSRYVGLEHVPRRSMWLDSSGIAASVTSTKAAFAHGDVLFGKLRPYFHKVVSAPSEGICSTDILVLRARDRELAGFLLAAAASDDTVERCTAASEGTRMPRASWKDLAAVSVPWPGDEEARSFSRIVDALRGRVEAAVAENVALAETRDALLPLLMSGKIRVKDAEGVVEEVV